MAKTFPLTAGEYTITVEDNPPGTIPGTIIVYLRNTTNDTETIIPLITAVKAKDI
jgi:hypothetical protein